MSDRPPWWLWPNLLALDAPAVAVLWQRFLAATAGLTLPVAPSLCLGLVVWGVYLLDRGLDARPGRFGDSADRHLFGRQHRHALMAVGGLASGAGAVVALVGLPSASFVDGLIVGLALATYLAAVHVLPGGLAGTKELAVGLVFAAGVAVPLAARQPEGVSAWGPAVAGFAGVCCLNCRLIDHWERGATALGPVNITAATLAITAGVWSPPAVGIALFGAVGLLVALHLAHRRVGPRATRVLADVALLTPVAVWRSL